MCYHYSLSKKHEELLRQMQAEWDAAFEPVHHANGFNFPLMPVLTNEVPGRVQGYHWGLIPHWVAHLADAAQLRTQTLNARAETIWEKPAFRPYVQQRCLVLADGFFEWREHQKKKYPHYVHLAGHALFAFAGLYAHWTDRETGECWRTFTILTTDANPLMARIHNSKQRMPVILEQPQWGQWLQPDLTREQMQALLQPCADTGMRAYSISKRITERGADTNVPEVYAPHPYAELEAGEQGSLFG